MEIGRRSNFSSIIIRIIMTVAFFSEKELGSTHEAK
jgi:hypothetical protein